MLYGQTRSRSGQYLLASAVSALLTIWGTVPRAEAAVMILWLEVAEEETTTADDIDTSSEFATEVVNDEFEFPLPPTTDDEGCHELDLFEVAPAAEIEDDGMDEFVDADIFETVMPEPPAIPSFAVDANNADLENLVPVVEAADSEAVDVEKLSTIERYNNCREIMESAELEPAAIDPHAVATEDAEEAAPTIDEMTRQAIEKSIHVLIERAQALQQTIADIVAGANRQTADQPVVADAESAETVEDITSSDPRDVIYNAQEAEVSDSYADDAGTYEHGEYEYDYDYGYEYYSDGYSYEDDYEYDEADDSVQMEEAVQAEQSECPFINEYEEDSADDYESDFSSADESSYDPEYGYSYDADFYEYAYDASDDEANRAEVAEQLEEEVPAEVDSAAVEVEPTRNVEVGDAAEAGDATFDYESHYDYDYGYDYEFDAEYAD